MRKIITLLFVFVASLFLINNNVKAFASTHEITYDFIYNNVVLKVQENNSDFSFDIYNNFFCSTYTSDFYCSFIQDEDLNKFYLEYSDDKVRAIEKEDFKFYYIQTNKDLSRNPYIQYISFYSSFKSGNVYTNISEYKDLTNVVYLDNGIEEKPEELEVTIKGTELLNFMLDKTRNIYEVLIANQIFVLCLGVLLSYLIFMVIYKSMRK